jgi:hypothetical protein
MLTCATKLVAAHPQPLSTRAFVVREYFRTIAVRLFESPICRICGEFFDEPHKIRHSRIPFVVDVDAAFVEVIGNLPKRQAGT